MPTQPTCSAASRSPATAQSSACPTSAAGASAAISRASPPSPWMALIVSRQRRETITDSMAPSSDGRLRSITPIAASSPRPAAESAASIVCISSANSPQLDQRSSNSTAGAAGSSASTQRIRSARSNAQASRDTRSASPVSGLLRGNSTKRRSSRRASIPAPPRGRGEPNPEASRNGYNRRRPKPVGRATRRVESRDRDVVLPGLARR